jgi:hypothetical protein
MRERVRLLDGTLDTGPLADGGFRVAAALPFDARPDTPEDPQPPQAPQIPQTQEPAE